MQIIKKVKVQRLFMKSPWGMSDEERKVADFTDKLADEIEAALFGTGAAVNASPLSSNSGFMIFARCAGTYSEIMVSRSRESEGQLVVDRFVGLYSLVDRTRRLCVTSDGLRKAADAYDRVDAFLEKKFGKYVSAHDNREIYLTPLEASVSK